MTSKYRQGVAHLIPELSVFSVFVRWSLKVKVVLSPFCARCTNWTHIRWYVSTPLVTRSDETNISTVFGTDESQVATSITLSDTVVIGNRGAFGAVNCEKQKINNLQCRKASVLTEYSRGL